jgi:hypothetical protein
VCDSDGVHFVGGEGVETVPVPVDAPIPKAYTWASCSCSGCGKLAVERFSEWT